MSNCQVKRGGLDNLFRMLRQMKLVATSNKSRSLEYGVTRAGLSRLHSAAHLNVISTSRVNLSVAGLQRLDVVPFFLYGVIPTSESPHCYKRENVVGSARDIC